MGILFIQFKVFSMFDFFKFSKPFSTCGFHCSLGCYLLGEEVNWRQSFLSALIGRFLTLLFLTQWLKFNFFFFVTVWFKFIFLLFEDINIPLDPFFASLIEANLLVLFHSFLACLHAWHLQKKMTLFQKSLFFERQKKHCSTTVFLDLQKIRLWTSKSALLSDRSKLFFVTPMFHHHQLHHRRHHHRFRKLVSSQITKAALSNHSFYSPFFPTSLYIHFNSRKNL